MILFFLYLRRCAYFSAIKSIKIQYRKQQNKKIKISPINPNSFSYLLRTPAKMESPQVTYENESSHLIIFFYILREYKNFSMWKSFNKKYILFLMHWMCRMHTLWSNLYNISLSHSLAAFTRWNSVHFFRYNFHHVELFFFYFHLVVVICEWNILMKNILKEKTRHFFCMIPRCRCAIQFISLSLSRSLLFQSTYAIL